MYVNIVAIYSLVSHSSSEPLPELEPEPLGEPLRERLGEREPDPDREPDALRLRLRLGLRDLDFDGDLDLDRLREALRLCWEPREPTGVFEREREPLRERDPDFERLLSRDPEPLAELERLRLRDPLAALPLADPLRLRVREREPPERVLERDCRSRCSWASAAGVVSRVASNTDGSAVVLLLTSSVGVRVVLDCSVA